jgi:hypothetical protein
MAQGPLRRVSQAALRRTSTSDADREHRAAWHARHHQIAYVAPTAVDDHVERAASSSLGAYGEHEVGEKLKISRRQLPPLCLRVKNPLDQRPKLKDGVS